MKNEKVIDETTVIRTIRTYPKEKYVGQWVRGRLYPLYNIVSDNGSKFVSTNGKMKDEPYVIYNKDTKEFYANDGWELRELSADSRITAMLGKTDAGDISEVVAEIVAESISPLQDEIGNIRDELDTLKEQMRFLTIRHYLTFNKNEGANVTITIPKGAIYSIDKIRWRATDKKLSITLSNESDSVYVCGDKLRMGSSNHFSTSGSGTVSCSGNIMSLYDAWNEVYEIPGGYTFSYGFYGCSNLTSAPDLPATTLSHNCYERLFAGTGLTTMVPELPALTLKSYCYAGMYEGCVSLTNPGDELPATTLAPYCYTDMYKGCTSLRIAPLLPAPELVGGCYVRLFYGCSLLNYVEAYFLTEPHSYYTDDWLADVSPTGTFVKSANATWEKGGDNAVPDGWEITT